MRFKNGAADAKPHAGAVRLGGKEGIEDLVRLLRGKPYAGVADRDQKLLVFRSLRLDGKLTRSIHVFHGLDAVDHEVHQDLLQLYWIAHYLGKICRQLRPDGYRVSHCLTPQEDDRLSNNLVYIYQLPLRSTLLE